MKTFLSGKVNHNRLYLNLFLVVLIFSTLTLVNLYSCWKTPKKEKHYFYFNDGGAICTNFNTIGVDIIQYGASTNGSYYKTGVKLTGRSVTSTNISINRQTNDEVNSLIRFKKPAYQVIFKKQNGKVCKTVDIYITDFVKNKIWIDVPVECCGN